MPFLNTDVPAYKPEKDIEVEWPSFNGGWNNLFKPTELKKNELAQADNLMLVGQGVPTGRWGSALSHLAGEAGRIRLLTAYYNSLTSTNLLLSITDSGYLTKKNGASYTIIPGASFASGVNYQAVELGNNTYLTAGAGNFIKFNGTMLIPYNPLSTPTNVSLAQLSSASGFNTYSWIITAHANGGGETLASVAKTLASLPLDLTKTSVRVSWNPVSAASGYLKGYEVYRGTPGEETWLAGVGPDTNQYIDVGDPTSDILFPPTSDQTAGPKAKYEIKFDDRIVLAGIDGDPSKVLISARFPFQDRFTAIDGGGYCQVSPNDGDDVSGLGVANSQGASNTPTSILVFKNNATHRIVLDTVTLGNFSILDPMVQVLTNSNGCSSADTVVAVENDTFYFGRKGLYTVGQEPNFLNQIRTNELSARIRPYVRNLSAADFRDATAGYMDNKYLLSFPNIKETVIYDRERACFMGPWKTPFGITKWLKYYDEAGTERWMAGTDTATVQELAPGYISDSGTAIAKTLRTRKEDMGNWSIMKVLKIFYVLFRNVKGDVTVNLRIEEPSGNTVTTKSFSISGNLSDGGWGSDDYGSINYGESDATVTLTGDEIVKFAYIYKNCRVLQAEVISTEANSNWEFLGVRFTAQGLGSNSLPSSDRV